MSTPPGTRISHASRAREEVAGTSIGEIEPVATSAVHFSRDEWSGYRHDGPRTSLSSNETFRMTDEKS